MTSVLLYIPNLIGYARIVLVLASFYYMPSSPYLAASLYLLSQVFLDFLDGVTARYFNQCSTFGAFLDMILDRCSVNGLFVVLYGLYPTYAFPIQLIIFIRFHSIAFYVMWRFAGPRSKEKDYYINTYYFGSKLLENIIWPSSELFPVLLYLLHFTDGPTIFLGGDFGEVRLFAFLAYFGFLTFVYRLVINIYNLCLCVHYFVNLGPEKRE